MKTLHTERSAWDWMSAIGNVRYGGGRGGGGDHKGVTARDINKSINLELTNSDLYNKRNTQRQTFGNIYFSYVHITLRKNEIHQVYLLYFDFLFRFERKKTESVTYTMGGDGMA